MIYDDIQTVLQAELEIQNKKVALRSQLEEELAQVQAQLAELQMPTVPDACLLEQLMGLSELGVSSLTEASLDMPKETAVSTSTKPKKKRSQQKKNTVKIEEPMVLDEEADELEEGPMLMDSETAVSATLNMEPVELAETVAVDDLSWLLPDEEAEPAEVDNLNADRVPVLVEDDNWLDAFG